MALLFYLEEEAHIYSGCHKSFPDGGSEIPRHPPLSKGDFQRNSAKFPPLEKGGRGI
jgi:hypothetical protein